MSKAAWGAIAGLGQGISQYGGLMGAEAIRKKDRQDEIDRQNSLEEIRRRYQVEDRQELRAYQDVQRDEGRTYMEDQRNEGREYATNQKIKASTPGNPEYDLAEAQRQMQRKETLADQKEIRAMPYGGGSNGGSGFGIYNPANFDDETNQAVTTAYQENLDSGMDPRAAIDDAQARIGVAGNLRSKPSFSGGAIESSTHEIINNEIRALKSQDKYGMIQQMLDEEVASKEELEDKTGPQLLNIYRKHLRENVYPIGLMNQGAPTFNTDPGSSQDNPIDITPGALKPPLGTWVRTPDGTVQQVLR